MPTTMDSKSVSSAGLRCTFFRLARVRSDARDHAVGVHVRVNDDDLDARARRVVDGLRVFRVADGGKDDRVRAIADGLPDVFVLRLVVLFRFRAKHGQIDVIFGLCRVRAAKTDFQNSVVVDLTIIYILYGSPETVRPAHPVRDAANRSARTSGCIRFFIVSLLLLLRHAHDDARSLVGDTLDGDAVGLAEPDFEPVVDVFDADAGFGVAAAENRVDLLFLHANAVILDGRQNIVPLRLDAG